ncbi:MAG: VanZ family protein [Wujia sp.]
MDLHQIIVTHNRPWTFREIVCFGIVLLIVVSVLIFLLINNKIRLSQALAALLGYIYMGFVFATTLFTRVPGARKYELIPFWSWNEVLFHGDRLLLEEILLNIIMLFPVGILLPVLCRKKLEWWKGFITGALISAVIEVLQLLLRRGWFEWDDMIHNGLGCMIGCMISGFIMNRFASNVRKR